jgi:hypothetical protein
MNKNESGVQPSPLYHAHKAIFERYVNLLSQYSGDRIDSATDLGHLLKMCQEGIENTTMLDDKASRWLGYVQGVLASKGLIDVDEERRFTRPLFHEAYRLMGATDMPTISV